MKIEVRPSHNLSTFRASADAERVPDLLNPYSSRVRDVQFNDACQQSDLDMIDCAAAGCGGAIGTILSKQLIHQGMEAGLAHKIAVGTAAASTHALCATTGTAMLIGRPLIRRIATNEPFTSPANVAEYQNLAGIAPSYIRPAVGIAAALSTRWNRTIRIEPPLSATYAAPMQAPHAQIMSAAAPHPPPHLTDAVVSYTSPMNIAAAKCCDATGRCLDASCTCAANFIGKSCSQCLIPGCIGCTTSIAVWGCLRLTRAMLRTCGKRIDTYMAHPQIPGDIETGELQHAA